jgi:hypothetical protein
LPEESLDKRVFIKNVRNWQTAVVELALAQEPSLARYKDQIGKTPLHHCAEINPQNVGFNVSDSIGTATALLAAGAEVNAVRIIIDDGEEFHATPLWYAVAWGRNFELAQLLLDNGALPDNNAIGAAIWDQDLRLAALLRSHGAEIDAPCRNETPLLRTVKARRLMLLKWLIDNGANINFQNDKGATALHYAVKGNHTLAQVEELLHYGADSTLAARDGSTAISLATDRGKTKLVALLERFG